MTVGLQLPPGTNLAESGRVASTAEQSLLQIPEVAAVSRRTGRAGPGRTRRRREQFRDRRQAHPARAAKARRGRGGPPRGSGTSRARSRENRQAAEEVLADIRERVGSIPGVTANVGQPISHRLDHIMSGVRAQVAVKVFGPDLIELRAAAQEVQDAMAKVPGVVDLQVEPQVEISQVRLRVKRDEAARYGLAPGDVAKLLETAYKGRAVSTVLDGEKSFSLVVWYDPASRSDPSVIGQTILDTPSGRKVSPLRKWRTSSTPPGRTR